MSMNGMIPAALTDRLHQAKQWAANRLLRPNHYANVVGVGIGKKVVNGCTTPTYCIRIYVVSKLDAKDLSPAIVVPSSILDVPTDIVEVGRFGRTGRFPKPAVANPLGPGFPIRVETNVSSVNTGFRGTLGAMVRDERGAGYLLSCNHVMAVNGRVPKGSKIVSAEFVAEEPTIATLRAFVPFSRDGANSVDCALARLVDDAKVGTEFQAIGNLRSANPVHPQLDLNVRKLGSSTGMTAGTIVDTSADLYVDYSFGTFRFDNQVMIDGGSDDEDFAALGDSGSLVVDPATKQATAMVFAASGRFAVACPLADVLQQLGERVGGNLTLVH